MRADPALADLNPGRPGVECIQPPAQRGATGGVSQIAFGNQQSIGHGYLADRLPVAIELLHGMGGIDNGDDPVALVACRNEPFLGERRNHRDRVGQPGGFDDDPRDFRYFAPRTALGQIPQGLDQITLHTAADAAGVEDHHRLVDPVHQVVIDADLAESTKTILFAKAHPARFFDVGAAEQNLIDIAAGLAIGGKRAFASSFAYFLTGRAWDQIRNIVAHDNLNVCLVASHGGFSAAADGASHLALQDIALMRVIPNMRVVVPSDAEETRSALDAAITAGGPFYLRLRRDKEPILQKPYKFKLGKAETMRDGSDITIAAYGPMVDAALKATAILRERKIEAHVLNVHTVKPLDADALADAEARRILAAVEVWLLDGNAYTSRPGPRVVDGAERIHAALEGRELPGLSRWRPVWAA